MKRHAACRVIVASLVVGRVASHARAAVLQTSLDTLVAGGSNAGGINFPDGMRFSGFAFRNTSPYNVNPADATVRISNEATTPGSLDHTDIQFVFGADAADGQAGDVFIDYRINEQDNTPINRAGQRFNGGVPSQRRRPGCGDGHGEPFHSRRSRRRRPANRSPTPGVKSSSTTAPAGLGIPTVRCCP